MKDPWSVDKPEGAVEETARHGLSRRRPQWCSYEAAAVQPGDRVRGASRGHGELHGFNQASLRSAGNRYQGTASTGEEGIDYKPMRIRAATCNRRS